MNLSKRNIPVKKDDGVIKPGDILPMQTGSVGQPAQQTLESKLGIESVAEENKISEQQEAMSLEEAMKIAPTPMADKKQD